MERVKLSSVFNVARGGSPRPIQNFICDDNDGVNWIMIGDTTTSKYITETKIKIKKEGVSKSRKVYPDDFLLTNSMSFGKPFITKIEGCIHDGWLVLSPINEKKICNDYFYYFLSSSNFKKDIERMAAGAVVKNINSAIVRNLEIPLPDLATQKAIAAKLDKADEIRQLNKKLIEQYDALTQSLFLDMFGDPVKNEKGWEMKILKELSKKIHSGNTPKGGSDVYVKKGIAFFRSQNVWKNRLIYDDIAFIDEQTHLSMSKSSLMHKDILMTKTGRINTENSSLGRAALYLGEDNQANVNGHVYFIRLKEKNVHEFIMYILTSKQYRDLIRSVCVGGIDKRQLNKDHIENFPIIFPPITLQNEFAERVKAIEVQKALAQQALQQSEDLFNSLLQESFK